MNIEKLCKLKTSPTCIVLTTRQYLLGIFCENLRQQLSDERVGRSPQIAESAQRANMPNFVEFSHIALVPFLIPQLLR